MGSGGTGCEGRDASGDEQGGCLGMKEGGRVGGGGRKGVEGCKGGSDSCAAS